MFLRSAAALLSSLILLGSPALADWKPPADGRFTEGQLKAFLDTQNNWLQELASVVHIAGSGSSSKTKVTAVADVGKLYQACLDRHHVSRAEFEWIAKSAADAWGAVAYLDGSFKTQQDGFDDQRTEIDAKLADAQKRLQTYQEAQKSGWRVLSADDRDALVKLARADQESALQEVKQRSDDIDARETEAKNDDADAKTADDEAANPPTDVSPDDRDEYVQNKKNEARAAREAAAETRTQEADEKKAEADAQALADAAGHRADHPEIPVTADDKAQAKADNDAGAASAQADIKQLQQEKVELALSESRLKQTAANVTGSVPPENIAIMRKYGEQYKGELSRSQQLGAATQPSN
jgi:hypothetical protein